MSICASDVVCVCVCYSEIVASREEQPWWVWGGMQPPQAAADKIEASESDARGREGGGGLDVASARRAKSSGLALVRRLVGDQRQKAGQSGGSGLVRASPLIALGFKGKPRPRPSPRISAVLGFFKAS